MVSRSFNVTFISYWTLTSASLASNHGLNQKWYYDIETKAIKAFSSNDKCLVVQGDGSLLQESECNNVAEQKFSIPFSWDPIMSKTSIFQEVRTDSDITLCMQLDKALPNGNLGKYFLRAGILALVISLHWLFFTKFLLTLCIQSPALTRI